VAVLAALAALCLGLRDVPLLRKGRPIVADAERPGPDWHLSYLRRGLDHDLLWHGLLGSAQAMKQADLLVLGDSSTLFAFAHESLEEFSRRTGLRCYVMALAYAEREDFAAALIKRHDLRPKWVIVNANPFFLHRESDMAQRARRSSAFDAWKTRLETVATYEASHALHRVLPHLDTDPLRVDWVLFRNDGDGAVEVAASSGEGHPARIAGVGTFAKAKESWIEGARVFDQWIRGRGGRLVLTTIPPRSPNIAIDIGEAVGAPVVVPDVPIKELRTIDGVHLDGPSARRYSEAFLAQLERIVRGEVVPMPERIENTAFSERKRKQKRR